METGAPIEPSVWLDINQTPWTQRYNDRRASNQSRQFRPTVDAKATNHILPGDAP
jgi:hypothetical protein